MSVEHFQPLIQNYKVKVSSRYISIDPETIERITPQDKYMVSTKYDGHFYGLVHTPDGTYFLNPKGKVVDELPLCKTTRDVLTEKGIKSVCLVGELYVPSKERSRAYNLTKAVTDKDPSINFAAFNILELEGEPIEDKDTFEVIELLEQTVPAEGKFHIVKHQIVDSRGDIKEIFDGVLSENEEGVVVKGEEFATYKVKPKYTFDAVVVGFAEGDGKRAGMVRDLLLAFRKEDGSYQVFAHLSHGFGDERRAELLKELTPKIVESDYIEVAANKVAFHMIKPDIVVEFSCLDVITEDSRGPIKKINLSYDEKLGYQSNYTQQTVSVTIPVYLRFRDDKEGSVQDVRFSQVEEVVTFDTNDNEPEEELKKSTIMKREVYVKESRGNVMLRKFVLFKTNKEKSHEYPAYVFHLTDVSTGRKDPLKRDIKVSDSEEQIMQIYQDAFKANVKKGWELVE